MSPLTDRLRAAQQQWIAIALACLVFATFGGALRNGFIGLDDADYITGNAQVRSGLTLGGAVWAFTTSYAGNWHPLTWLSHMLDVELYGLAAGGHHLTSVLLHALTTGLLFLALHRLTAATWRSAIAAALFGLHPLRVESVAWAAERKDVLGLLFGVLTLVAYSRYVEQPSRGRLAATAALFALGLLSKPVLVTLPFALLLLDVWPLRRFEDPVVGPTLGSRILRLASEKLPLFLLAAGSSLITYLVQTPSRGILLSQGLALSQRLANAVVASAAYLQKTVWPAGLAVLYPHPWLLRESVPTQKVLAAAGLLSMISLLALWQARRRPWLLVGWLWYLGTLVPMLGIVQVGYQSMADRYSYLPSIGLAIALVWGAADLSARWPFARRPAAVAAVVALACFALLTQRQVQRWRTSSTLYTYTLGVTDRNWVISNNLAAYYLERGNLQAALQSSQRTMAFVPDSPAGWYSAGTVLARLGRPADAVVHLRRAVELAPNDRPALINLGASLIELDRYREAATTLERALPLGREDPLLLYHLAVAQERLGNPSLALEYRRRLDAIDPKLEEKISREKKLLQEAPSAGLPQR